MQFTKLLGNKRRNERKKIEKIKKKRQKNTISFKYKILNQKDKNIKQIVKTNMQIDKKTIDTVINLVTQCKI